MGSYFVENLNSDPIIEDEIKILADIRWAQHLEFLRSMLQTTVNYKDPTLKEIKFNTNKN